MMGKSKVAVKNIFVVEKCNKAAYKNEIITYCCLIMNAVKR
jgi:hypothetical protein